MLESFFTEIQILSQCDHPNIVRFIDASFNGTLVKEIIAVRKTSVEYSALDYVDTRGQCLKDGDDNDENSMFIKRKTGVCYCVLKLARHGELFKILEHTDKFTDKLARSLFKQLITGNIIISEG